MGEFYKGSVKGDVQTSADFVCGHFRFKFVYAHDDFQFGMSQFFHGCSFATKGGFLTKGIPFCLVMNSPNFGETYKNG